MDAHLIAVLIAGAGVLGVVVWLLAKAGKVLLQIVEALAAAALVFVAGWLVLKAGVWAIRQTVTHWRTSSPWSRSWRGGTAGAGCRW